MNNTKFPHLQKKQNRTIGRSRSHLRHHDRTTQAVNLYLGKLSFFNIVKGAQYLPLTELSYLIPAKLTPCVTSLSSRSFQSASNVAQTRIHVIVRWSDQHSVSCFSDDVKQLKFRFVSDHLPRVLFNNCGCSK